ncbi:IS982 family transposase (plasmid) [Deinococcus sp. KNUC1210]|uniref:IS982 family transposase n=1 Tax=Deinococcus sp. KNUC1210 TaxID=2917691 RepID=UPI001EF09392|nr:IS982 family transposase [Deinococcus sp. KNUC1210]ULH18201.1 IS982 family transposase [Deinococcus sp. KNUC1210]
MCRLNLSVQPIHTAFERLTAWLEPQMPAELVHAHEKISDAQLVAAALLQRIHKFVYFRCWWQFLKLNHFAWFPSEVQARIRLVRLTPVIKGLSVEVQILDFVIIDSEPLPISTFKWAPRCKFPGAAHGFGTAGPVYGFKLHAWTTLTGKIAQYEIHPANLHDFTVGCIMNRDWPAYGGPKQIGDKEYQSGTYLTPPKNNAKRLDPRWKEEYAAARKIIEFTFSVLFGSGLRWGQVKTMLSLRLKVGLLVMAHHLKFRDLAT